MILDPGLFPSGKFDMPMARNKHTAIPNREVQGFYREIRVQGNSNYMLCQCTGFEGSNFNEIQGKICILYRN